MPSPLEFGQYLRGLFLGFWVVVFFGIFLSDFFVDFGVFSSYFSFFSGLFFSFFIPAPQEIGAFFRLKSGIYLFLKVGFLVVNFSRKIFFLFRKLRTKIFRDFFQCKAVIFLFFKSLKSIKNFNISEI